MAKFGIIIHEKGDYLRAWLKYVCRKNDITVVDKKEADILLISISDPTETSLILEARKYNKPIILGGSECFNDLIYGFLVDVINIGEGFELFKELGKAGKLSSKQIIGHLKKLPYIYHPGKEAVIPSTFIDWKLYPVVLTGKNRKTIVGSKGCKNRCKFCFTSWTNKYQENPYTKNMQTAQMIIIANDNAEVMQLNQKSRSRTMSVKSYLKMNKLQADNCHCYHLGVESFSEETRKYFNKPISNVDLRRVYNKSQEYRHKLTIYIIAGYDKDDSIDEFSEAIGQDTTYKKPTIEIKCTYIDPSMHTPLASYDIRKVYKWDERKILGKLNLISQRFRLTIRKTGDHATWRACFHRSRTPEQAITVWKWRNKPREYMFKEIEKRGWLHMYNQTNPTVIDFRGKVG